MSSHEVAAMFQAEHDAFSELIGTLPSDDWARPSLCEGWSVQQVVTHAAFHIHRSGVREFLGSTDHHTALSVEREHAETIDGLVRWFTSPCTASAAGSRVNLCEIVIHQQDVRRPLGMARTYHEATMRACLDFCAHAPGRIFVLEQKRNPRRGLRLSATDLDWSIGDGPEVRGSGEALLMALAGRPVSEAELSGPGVAALAARL